MTLGQRIYQLRTQANLSQEELAEKTGVSRQSVSKWETDASIPELDKLIQLASIFGVTLDCLVRGDDKKTDAEFASLQTDSTGFAAETAGTEAPVTPLTHTEERSSGISTVRKVIGCVLFAVAFLGMLFALLHPNAAILLLLIVSTYLFLCGLLCFTIRKRFALAFCVMTFAFLAVLISIYLISISARWRGRGY